MKITKLKKSLSIIYLTKISVNSSFFILSEKKETSSVELSYTLKIFSNQFNLKDLKYPLSLMIITNLSQILEFKSPFFLVNFKEFFWKTNSSAIFYSLKSLNAINNFDSIVFFNPDATFQILTTLNNFKNNISTT
jgi:hypothetical protein